MIGDDDGPLLPPPLLACRIDDDGDDDVHDGWPMIVGLPYFFRIFQ